MALTFGLDVSHHQPILDWSRAKREGIEFAFLKATEGSTFKDSDFQTNLNAVRSAGIIPAAYHYVRSNASVASQVANVVSMVPKDVPVILDVETNSGGIQMVRDLTTALKAAGYKVPLLYLPRWYWQQIGSPSLVGLPPLWSSRYPDYVVRSLSDAYAKAPASYWNSYGGLGVSVLQFTSSANVAGHSPLDANAYLGTRNQLLALLYGTNVEDDMEQSELIYDPATGKPALDTNGKTYTVGQVLYYDNLNGWSIREQLEQLEAKMGDAVKTAVADYLKANPPVVNVSVDYAAVAKAVNDEMARRQAE
jgi:hypothetical protein